MEEFRDIMRARDIANPDERHALLHDVLIRLVSNHLRVPPNEGPDEVGRVLMIITHLASRQAGAFAWGEPTSVASIVLGLIEQLPTPDEERQTKVLAALEPVLLLLQMGSARALFSIARETVALLQSLPEKTPGDITAFTDFATFGSTPDDSAGTTVAPATLRVGSPGRLAWARLGLLRMGAFLHAHSPQFVDDGGPGLWSAVLEHLMAPPVAPAAHPPPPLVAALGVLRMLLGRIEAPPPVRSELLSRLIAILAAGLPASSAAAAAAAAAARSNSTNHPMSAAGAGVLPSGVSAVDRVGHWTNASVPPCDALPAYRTEAFDTLIGESIGGGRPKTKPAIGSIRTHATRPASPRAPPCQPACPALPARVPRPASPRAPPCQPACPALPARVPCSDGRGDASLLRCAALIPTSVPPLDCLPALLVALPYALAMSASATLHSALCALLLTLPAEPLEVQAWIDRTRFELMSSNELQ